MGEAGGDHAVNGDALPGIHHHGFPGANLFHGDAHLAPPSHHPGEADLIFEDRGDGFAGVADGDVANVVGEIHQSDHEGGGAELALGEQDGGGGGIEDVYVEATPLGEAGVGAGENGAGAEEDHPGERGTEGGLEAAATQKQRGGGEQEVPLRAVGGVEAGRGLSRGHWERARRREAGARR